jgi:hypothetical protein
LFASLVYGVVCRGFLVGFWFFVIFENAATVGIPIGSRLLLFCRTNTGGTFSLFLGALRVVLSARFL